MILIFLLEISHELENNEDEEICCNVDEEGYIFDEYGESVVDQHGNIVKLKPEEIKQFQLGNMIE